MAMERENKKSFESSLKSIETENFLDRIFYRPIGYRIALLLSKTPITPNVVTIISIFVGVFAGILFYYQNIYINLIGFALLVVANILDCVTRRAGWRPVVYFDIHQHRTQAVCRCEP